GDAGQQRAVNRTGDPSPEGRHIGAEVCDRLDSQSEEMPLVIKRQFRICLVIATLVVSNKALAACADPFHRYSQAPCRPCDDGFFGIVFTLVTEPAPDIRRNESNSGLRQIELLAHSAPNVMWHLRGTIERQLAACAAIGQNRAWFNCCADQPIVDEIEPHHMRRGGNDFTHGSVVATGKAKTDITGCSVMQLRRAFA